MAELDAFGGEFAHAAAGDVAAGDDQVQSFAAEAGDHVRDDGFIVLEIAVHDDDEGSGGGEHAFDAGRGEADAADALQDADARVDAAELAADVGGAVGGVVIDEEKFPVFVSQDGGQFVVEDGDVGPFFEDGDNDGDIRGGRANRADRTGIGGGARGGGTGMTGHIGRGKGSGTVGIRLPGGSKPGKKKKTAKGGDRSGPPVLTA